MATGITKRGTTFEAWVWSPKDGRKVYRRFPSYAAARSWRADAKRQIDQGALRAPTETTSGRPRMRGSKGPSRGRYATVPALASSPRPCAATGRRSTRCCRCSAAKSSRR